MSDFKFIEYLKNFGLTGQEAIIYEMLLKNDAMTGYEVAKETGISRSNVYASLSGLVDKGAAHLMEGEPTRYTAVSIKLFCDNALRELKESADYLKEHAPEPVKSNGGYVTIQGGKNIRNTIRNMLDACEKRLYILAEAKVIEEYDTELKRLIKDGRKVVIISKDYELFGAKVYNTAPEPFQIRFIVDSEYVLTGEFKDSETDNCLYSRQPNLVAVMKEALRNRIIMIENNYQDHINAD